MKNLLAAILFAAMSFGMTATVVVKNPSQRKQLIDDGWQFRLTADDKGTPACGEWRNLNLPHDWSVEADFDSLAAAGNDGGYLPAGKGCAPTGQCLSSTISTWPMWQPKSWTAKGAWCPMPSAESVLLPKAPAASLPSEAPTSRTPKAIPGMKGTYGAGALWPW